MIVRKYPQSHLVLEKNGKKLVIDPGYITFDKGYKLNQFQNADAYLITHLHDDHLGYQTIKQLVGNQPVFANTESIKKLVELGVKGIEIKDRQIFEVAGFKIQAVDLPHFRVPDDKVSPQNTGFLIDGIFFHAGDGFEVANVQSPNAALAYGHPSLSVLSVLDFAKNLKAKVLIPIHFDAYPRDPEELKKAAGYYHYDLEVRSLSDGEETEI